MAAALGAADTGANVLLVEREASLGGILNQCTHSGFGLTYFNEELTGQQYALRFADRIASSQVTVLTDTMVLDISDDGTVTLTGATTGLARIKARALVLASGCRERTIGALNVAGTRPAGVFTAGAAQKMINLGGYSLGNRFVILGSGDVGLIVARELATRGKEVIAVIEQNETCGGLARNRINCLERYDIPLITRSTVTRLHGEHRLTGVTAVDLDRGDTRLIDCDTLITSVGLIPERELLDGFATLPEFIFLCGNACFVHDVVDDVTVESERAGRLAAEYVLRGELKADAVTENIRSGDVGGMICIACPKSCIVRRETDIWQGLACGRDEPVFESG